MYLALDGYSGEGEARADLRARFVGDACHLPEAFADGAVDGDVARLRLTAGRGAPGACAEAPVFWDHAQVTLGQSHCQQNPPFSPATAGRGE